MAASKDITAEQRRRFLEALAEHRNATMAARAAGITRRAALDLKARDPDFAAAWDDAAEEATDLLDHAAREWAMKGVEVPVFYHGESKGATRLYSEELLLLFLRAERPEKFGAPGAGEDPAGRKTIERAGRKAVARAAANGTAGNGAAEDGGRQDAAAEYEDLQIVPRKDDPEVWTRRVTESQKRLVAGGPYAPG